MNKPWQWTLAAAAILALAGCVWYFSPKPSNEATAVLEGLPASTGNFRRILGPENLLFPQDFGAHNDTQTEWWYFTGNLASPDGRKFGYQLTFFRRGLVGPDARTPRTSDWAADQVYLAHFVVTDGNGGVFHPFERLERGTAGLAGAVGEPAFAVWLRDWSVEQTAPDQFRLHALESGIGLDLVLKNKKGLVLQGDRGYSQKGPDPGNASTYISLTRLESSGTIALNGQLLSVLGLSWMDHEYGTSALAKEQIGWDWFSMQLGDQRELMLYQIRRSDGTLDGYSKGVIIQADGSKILLNANDFQISVDGSWKSPHSGGNYPSGWTISVPSQKLVLKISPLLKDQELNNSFVYWEGAVEIDGTSNGKAVSGKGYTELTGYARSFEGGF